MRQQRGASTGFNADNWRPVPSLLEFAFDEKALQLDRGVCITV